MPQAVNGMKYCGSRKCTKTNPQPVSNFNNNKKTIDRLDYECKTCKAIRRRTPQYRERMRIHSRTEQWKKANKRYQRSEKGKAADRARKSTPDGKERLRRYRQSEAGKRVERRVLDKYPIHRKARTAVYNAVRDGKLPRASMLQCSRCLGQAQQYHHHNGYEKEHWLDVIPLCISCHSILNNQPYT